MKPCRSGSLNTARISLVSFLYSCSLMMVLALCLHALELYPVGIWSVLLLFDDIFLFSLCKRALQSFMLFSLVHFFVACLPLLGEFTLPCFTLMLYSFVTEVGLNMRTCRGNLGCKLLFFCGYHFEKINHMHSSKSYIYTGLKECGFVIALNLH